MTECTSQDAAMRAEFEAWAAEEWAGRSVPDNAWLGWKGAMAAMQQRLAENAEIVAVYDKLHQHNVVGGHWMWGMVAQAAESGDAEQALRDHGLVRLTEPMGYPELPALTDDSSVWMAIADFYHSSGGAQGKEKIYNAIRELMCAYVDADRAHHLQSSKVHDGAASLNSGAAKGEQ